jgi:IPT/TIG domain
MEAREVSSGGALRGACNARLGALARHGRRTGLVWLAVAIFLGAGANAASALIVHVNGETFGIEPAPAAQRATEQASGQTTPAAKGSPAKENAGKPAAKQQIGYHGGPIMPSNTNYALYWDPSGAPEYPAGYQSGIDRYFEDLAHDSGGDQNTDSILTQYGDQAGEYANYNSHFGGALIDTDAYPANGCSAAPICLTVAQLRTEITKYVEAHGLPMDLDHEYFLLTPPGVESCIEAAGHECSAGTKHSSYCSFHSYISTGTGTIIYANTPFMEGTNCDYGEEHPNNNSSDATLGGGLVHEHSESLTDPEFTAWYYEKGKEKEEIADRCRTFKEATEYGEPLGRAPDGAKYNQVINGDLYYYQQMWSNATGACEQRTAQPPTITKVSPKSGPATGKTSVKITGKNFTSPATVKFGEASATEVTVNSSTSITAVSPAGSVGTVNITVTTSAGTSATTTKDHFKYKKANG